MKITIAFLLASGCATVAPATAKDPVELDGTARKLEGERYLEYRVGTTIEAEPEEVWALLTDAPGYREWNSTLIELDGEIALGKRIELRPKHDPKRKFGLDVSTFEPPTKMVWQDGNKAFKGVRTFTLTRREDGSTEFTMVEALTGAFLPMIAKKLPDLRPSFRDFAADLKRAAEADR